MLAALFLVAATGCHCHHRGSRLRPPLPAPMDQLEEAAPANPQDFSNGEDILSFITEDRTVACSLTSARGEHINLPYETNAYSSSANNRLAILPVAHCELATYPKPGPDDVRDDCAGTGLGYLGGVALLTPDKALYGECRSGVTQMEATCGPRGSRTGLLAQLPVLAGGAQPGTQRAAVFGLQRRRGMRKRLSRRRILPAAPALRTDSRPRGRGLPGTG